jgi:hypothetical protein
VFMFSEMRSAYEVTNERKNWEIIIGKLMITGTNF